jgi:hypothetical protein
MRRIRFYVVNCYCINLCSDMRHHVVWQVCTNLLSYSSFISKANIACSSNYWISTYQTQQRHILILISINSVRSSKWHGTISINQSCSNILLWQTISHAQIKEYYADLCTINVHFCQLFVYTCALSTLFIVKLNCNFSAGHIIRTKFSEK